MKGEDIQFNSDRKQGAEHTINTQLNERGQDKINAMRTGTGKEQIWTNRN